MSDHNTKNLSTRKSCVVPQCRSTTTNSLNKMFFLVPKDLKVRKIWMEAMKRKIPISDKSTVYCCEDHFDVEKDMFNYIKYKLVGGLVKLKKNVIPHKFECQKKVFKVKLKPKLTKQIKKKRVISKNDMEISFTNVNEYISTNKEDDMEQTSLTEEEIIIKEEDPLDSETESDDHVPIENETSTTAFNEPSTSTASVEDDHSIKDILHFFKGLTPTIKSFSPYYQHLAKERIFQVVQELEWEQISAEQKPNMLDSPQEESEESCCQERATQPVGFDYA